MLRWYVFKEPSGAFARAARDCSALSGGRYRIELADLPADADQQREQLVRRLAARDRDIDIIGMDVIWTAEFAEAGWVLEWRGAGARAASSGTIPATLETGRYEGKLYAAPFTTNAQLLWYRKDRLRRPPRTWDEMVRQAERLGHGNRIQVQAARYEGLTVWFTSLLASAGGRVLDEAGEVALGPPAVEALEVMRAVAGSPAADPSLANSREDETRLAFQSGTSTFMVNYPYVYASAREEAPEVFRNLGWARWPRVLPDEPSRVVLGGLNLGVAAYSEHPREAFAAALCLKSPANQVVAAAIGGLPPTQDRLYDDARVRRVFPFADLLRDALRDAARRPASPVYNDISLAVQMTLHPPREIEPRADAERLRERTREALRSGGLL